MQTLTSEATVLDLVRSFLDTDGGDAISSDDASGTATLPPASVESEYREVSVLTSEEKSAVIVLIFSKDRPWQLQQLLRSFQLEQGEEIQEQDLAIEIAILARIQEEYREGYRQVNEEFQGFATFLEEDPSIEDSNFRRLLLYLIDGHTSSSRRTHWLFLTDDCLLLVPLSHLLQTACRALAENAEVVCFLSRLHPGISFCQTRDKPCLPPSRFMQYRKSHDTGAYIYPLHRGVLDWNYPWDLSGGVYRDSLVRDMFECLRENDALSHPNTLEIGGNEVLASDLSSVALSKRARDPHCSIPTTPMLLVLAINRVQNMFQAPLACDESIRDLASTRSLLQLLSDDRHLDILYYKRRGFSASHIGNFILVDDTPHQEETTNVVRVDDSTTSNPVAVSVLMPVHTGPPDAAYHAMTSVAIQPVEHNHRNGHDNKLSPLQIVLVDDRCVDGSIDAMLEALVSVERRHDVVVLSVRDHRNGSMDEISTREEPAVHLIVDIFASPKPGIAAALNYGLCHCEAHFVARMDADDISAPGRLIGQLSVLETQSNLSVVGMNSIIFREAGSGSSHARPFHESTSAIDALPYFSLRSRTEVGASNSLFETRVSLQPTDPCFTAWTMLFSCCVSHPSVMYRKDVIQELGAYSEDLSSAEDYDLWLRLTRENCRSLSSIPAIGLWHRKHHTRPAKASKQSEEALRSATHSFSKLVGDDADDSEFSTTVAALRNPELALSGTHLDTAALLLMKMEQCFLELHSDSVPIRSSLLIREDCNSRLGELATLVCLRFGKSRSMVVNESVAWTLWCERSPHQSIERIALLAKIKD